MQLHELKPATKSQHTKTVGRGGKRGKTSGRGAKGQRARSGHRIRPEARDLIKKLPKLRGRGKNSLVSLNAFTRTFSLNDLEAKFKVGDTVSPKTLKVKGLVKILADGKITKKLSVEDCKVSATAKAAIEKAGGSVKSV